MTKSHIRRQAVVDPTTLSDIELQHFNKDSKMRCKYCDMKFQHKDRLHRHEQLCETTCFNFYHKLQHNGFTNNIFDNTRSVIFNGENVRINSLKFNTTSVIDEPEIIELLDIEPIIPSIELIDEIETPPVYNDPSDLGIGDIIPYDDFEDNLELDNLEYIIETMFNHTVETKCQLDKLIDEKETLQKEISVENNISNDVMSIELIYDEYDEELLNVKNFENHKIIDSILDNPNNDLLFYKCITKDEYDNIQYVSICKCDTNQYLVDFVIDYMDVDFMNWRSNNL